MQQKSLQRIILNYEISNCIRDKFNIRNSVDIIKNTISFCGDDATHFISVNLSVFNHNLKKYNSDLYSKFQHLLNTQQHLPDIHFEDTFVENISGEQIPYEMLLLLSLGPKFALPPDTLPIPDMIRDIEYIISRSAHPSIINAVRSQMAYTITRHSKKPIHLNRVQRFLHKCASTTTDFLKNHPQVFISNSDKGNKTIICKKDDYEQKMLLLLNNEDDFVVLNNDPTTNVERKLNNKIDELFKDGYYNKYKKIHIKSTTGVAPRVYGLYKIHKAGHPLRIIASTIKSPTYNLAKELSIILTNAFRTPKYNLKNSDEALNHIRTHRLLRDHRLVSFDMVNCFGSIPVGLILELINEQYNTIQPHTNLPRERFVELLNFCLTDGNYMQYKGIFYHQKNGIAMGSSLGSILVQVVTEHIIDLVSAQLKNERIPIPPFWKVYVDDHLLICRQSNITTILNKLNDFHPMIKFTSELEVENRLNYLDITLIRDNGTIITDWYTKSIASGRILNYMSAHPKQMITNTAIAFVKKVFRFSDPVFHANNTNRITDILRKNNFPLNEIHRIIGLAKIPTDHNRPPTQCANNNYYALTYVPGVSESLCKQLRYFLPEANVAHKPEQKLNQFYSKKKDPIPDSELSDVVYKIDCNDCSAVYIGETAQRLKTRMQQHKSTVNTTTAPKTALAKHAKDNGHVFDFDGVTILERNRFKRKLQICEVNHIIFNQDNACNFKSDTAHISPTYFNLLRHHVNKSNIVVPVHTQQNIIHSSSALAVTSTQR